MNLQWQGFSDSRSHTVRMLSHEGALLSTVQCLPYYWEKEERKGLEVQCKYNFIMDLQKTSFYSKPGVFFVIMLFPPATKRDQVFIQDQP